MLIRILYFIFFVVLARFVVSAVRGLFRLGSGNTASSGNPERIDPTQGEKVIDVEFTEHPDPDSSRKGAR